MSTTISGDLMITVDDRAARALVDALERALDGPSLGAFVMGPTQEFLRQRATARFRNEGDSAVGAWAPLMDYTNLMRVQGGFTPEHPINRRTGELENFITRGSNDVTVTPVSATLTMPGSNPGGELGEKLATAQQGKPFPYTVPRPVLGMDETDTIAVLASLGGWLVQEVEAGMAL